MTMLDTLRDRLPGGHPSSGPEAPSDAPAGSAEKAPLPFDGYDKLDDKHVINGMSDHSQVELEAVESYERSHQSRERVLDKLRYMRQGEPLPGYDALSVEDIVAAIKEADVPMIKKIRGYEKKFANRPDILDEVVRVHHQHLEDGSGTTSRK
jgi:hypothetical protein